jgi:hypothetical protein
MRSFLMHARLDSKQETSQASFEHGKKDITSTERNTGTAEHSR